MHLQENTLFDLNLAVKVTQNVALNNPHHVIYVTVKFKVVMSNGLGQYIFTRKNIILPSNWGQGHTKCSQVHSTSCDLCTCKV